MPAIMRESRAWPAPTALNLSAYIGQSSKSSWDSILTALFYGRPSFPNASLRASRGCR